MKVTVLSLTDESIKRREYKDVLTIEIDGKRVFEVYDGESEDANLMRDFNDCFKIPDLLRSAYEAGKAGEDFSVEIERVDELY